MTAASARIAGGPNTTQQHAVDWLRRAIVNGDLRPGERVPQEDVADRIGVSVAPVREALDLVLTDRVEVDPGQSGGGELSGARLLARGDVRRGALARSRTTDARQARHRY